MRVKLFVPVMISLILVASSQVLAATHIPETMNYQGYLTDPAGNPINGLRNMTFSIYSQAVGGGFIWQEPVANVPVNNGIFNVVLGLGSPIASLVPFRSKYWLGITVAPDVVEMSPRHELTNSAFAMAARKVVHQQVLTVAHDGGDAPTVTQALAMIGSEPTAPPTLSNEFLIEVQAGQFIEVGAALVIPDYVTVRGQGWEVTTLMVDYIDMTGAHRALENLKVVCNANGPGVVDMQGAVYSYVRDCKIETNIVLPAINMNGAVDSAALNNLILCYGGGSGMGIVVSAMNDSRVENNVINLNHVSNPAANIGSYGISDLGFPMVEGYILKNTIQYVTTGVVGPGPSYGIGLAGGGVGQVSFNVFMHGTPGKDIVDFGTGNPPGWAGPPAINPHGIVNQDSTGAIIAPF